MDSEEEIACAEHQFSRISPASFYQSSGGSGDWVVVHYSVFPSKAQRRRLHGAVVQLRTPNKTIYRRLRFGGSLYKNQLVIDWLGWIELDGRNEEAPDIQIIEIRIIPKIPSEIAYAFNHPDPSVKLAIIVSFASLIISVIGIFSGSGAP